MNRKLLPSLIALVALVAGLLWGLFKLQGVFAEERDDALSSVDDQVAALEDYARIALSQALDARLDNARPRFAVLDDPFEPQVDLYLRERGKQVLPPTNEHLGSDETPAAALFQKLERGEEGTFPEFEDAQDPWGERLRLRVAFLDALRAGETAAMEERFKAILRHRLRFDVGAVRDLPDMLSLLSIFFAEGDPAPALIDVLLKDGLDLVDSRFEALPVALMRAREDLSRQDFEFLSGKILELCKAGRVSTQSYRQGFAVGPSSPLAVPESLPGPVLSPIQDMDAGPEDPDTWYLVQEVDGRVIGTMVPLQHLISDVDDDMHERGLLDKDDVLLVSQPTKTLVLDRIALTVRSERFADQREVISSRFRLKTLLDLTCALLVVSVAVLAFVAQRRKQRFVELKSDFVSAVSHELRTPLASIRLLAETLERRLDGDPRARDYPTRIVRDIDGLGFLVENILSFNRLDRGRLEPKPERISLSDFGESLRADADLWSRRSAQLDLDEFGDAVLHADPDLVRLVLINLIRNACTYNKRTPIEISLSSAREGADVVIRVRDNGVGIPAGEQRSVFGEFIRGTAGSKTSRGSGLGLAICRRIMHAHGGDIAIESSSPEGTTFKLCFPQGKRT